MHINLSKGTTAVSQLDREVNFDWLISAVPVDFYLPLRSQRLWWEGGGGWGEGFCLAHAKNCFQLCLKISFGEPLNFHQQLIKYFPFKNWLNFLALKIKKLLERRLKGTGRRTGRAATESRGRAFEEHSVDLHRNSSGSNLPAVFPLWTECPRVPNTPVLVTNSTK